MVEQLHDGIEQIAATTAMQGADRVRLAETEAPERGGVRLGAQVVDLVGREDDRFPGSSADSDDVVVGVSCAHLRVDHEDHDVGHARGELGLGGDQGRQASHIDFVAAGVEKGEEVTSPFGVVGHAVARHTRLVLYHRLAAADDAVDEGRLADVGPPDDRHHWPVCGVLRLFLDVQRLQLRCCSLGGE